MNDMVNRFSKNIVIDPDILDGTPVIAGTRIPIERVKELVKQGYTPDSLQKEYPQIKLQTIQEIISSLMEVGLDDFKKTYKTQALA
jgi:uncharacterized protein (DUF433 family)